MLLALNVMYGMDVDESRCCVLSVTCSSPCWNRLPITQRVYKQCKGY